MSDFDYGDLLVSPAQAREAIIERIEALNSCSDDASVLASWYEETLDVLDAVYVSGARRYFDKNGGFEFSYFMNKPKQLTKANQNRAIGILQRLADQLTPKIQIPYEATSPESDQESVTNEVFVVHGHDKAGLSEVARSLEKLKLKPIVLQEQANRGATIIEKFEVNSKVGFAVILMTADDLGGNDVGDISNTEFKPRARQNVILELGYFVGTLGRERVCVLKTDGVEAPSDIFGVVYTPFDNTGRWKFDLVRELKAAGYAVSADDIL